jgi:hypothetical protein
VVNSTYGNGKEMQKSAAKASWLPGSGPAQAAAGLPTGMIAVRAAGEVS